MNVRFSRLAIAFISSALAVTTAVHAQDAKPCPNALVPDHGKSMAGKPLASPAATAEVTLGGKKVSITYNAPSVRCRTVMGGLVPYGKVWRFGANAATTLTTDSELKIGDLTVPAGTYTLYALPAAAGTPWQLIVNKQTKQWGTVYDEKQDFGRTPMMFTALPKLQETMTLSFEHSKGKKAELHMRWENTDVYVPVVAK
ncbi:DUF2911 domain-containing protein [Granulicella cerasi]|uniref:DUF2911 domain-containing protein n=1 Tax=Granulicella cerasi TaxID=741063 RepID=A0ABW1ZBX2_9BACT|nr:DUF2911 domain-containing protein [Granulicella cerasi]